MESFNNEVKLKLMSEWNLLKQEINFSKNYPLFFKKREIWWASIGSNIGREEDGKNHRFERPVLILKTFGSETMIICPLTSKRKNDIFHFSLNSSDKKGLVILSQIKLISNKRLIRKIYKISNTDFLNILNNIKKFFDN